MTGEPTVGAAAYLSRYTVSTDNDLVPLHPSARLQGGCSRSIRSSRIVASHSMTATRC